MQYLDRPLFPLSKLSLHYDQYFMDAIGEVFSTKKTKYPTRLSAIIKNGKFYILNSLYEKIGIKVDAHLLFISASNHGDFIKDTAKVEPPAPKEAVQNQQVYVNDNNYASTIDEGLTKKGWIVAEIQRSNGAVRMYIPDVPTIHLTEASYKASMIRRIAVKPDAQFVALKIETSLVANGLDWT